MKTRTRQFLKPTALIILSFLIIISCKEDDPSGAEGALGKQFNLALGQVTSSLATSILVSADGTKIFVSTSPTGGPYYYSADGGKTFTQKENIYLRYATYIDNQGNILTSDKYLFVNSAATTVTSFDELILGDNGKIFSYNQNSGTIKYKNISSGDFTAVTMPITPTPGSGGSTYYCKKAPGKGLLFIDVSGSGTRTVKAFLLDEVTMMWSTHTLTFDTNSINNCTTLNRFERFAYLGSNIVTVKGCTGTAMLDLATSNTTYLNYPNIENAIDTDLRDGQIFLDNKKQVYIVVGTYADLNKKFVYRYNGTTWSQLDGYVALSQLPVFTADQAGNIYYNASDGAGESIQGAVKINVTTNEKTPLALPLVKLNITDAAAISSNTLLVVVEGRLYEHDITGNTITKMSLSDINHINVLSDGRLLAGGPDKVYLSSDDGKSWTETKKVFSSVDATKAGFAVTRSRIVNGKIMLTGVYSYTYNNLSLGITQNKYDNVVVEFDGSGTTKLSYQFPSDFLPSAIGPDATIYGVALFVSEFGTISDVYELKQNVTPERLKMPKGSPQIVTDDGLQMSVLNAKTGGGYEVVTRGSSGEDWASTNTPLPAGSGSGTLVLRQSGDRLVFIHDTEVYVSGN